MNTEHGRPPFSTISGTSVRLSERDTIAIYRWDGLSWVAHFRYGCGELSDAATWFRVHAGLLRSCRVGSAAAIETVELLTPEMISRIARLHRRTEAQRSSRAVASTILAAAFRRACAQIASALHGWSDRLIRRAG
jgi:hypothetical protein